MGKKSNKSPRILIYVVTLLCVGIVFLLISDPPIFPDTMGTSLQQEEVKSPGRKVVIQLIDDKLLSLQSEEELVNDIICKQFDPEYVSSMMLLEINEVQPIYSGGNYGCVYQMPIEELSLTILVENGSMENKKNGHELIGREVFKSFEIQRRNYVVTDRNGKIVVIYLKINDVKFIQISQNDDATKIIDTEMIKLASDIATYINEWELN